MNDNFRITAVQAAAVAIGQPRAEFEAAVRDILAEHPDTAMLVYPELHLFHSLATELAEQTTELHGAGVTIGGEFTDWLASIAREHGIWFIPGSIVESNGDDMFNTAVVFSPQGELVARYRKMFPWRPFEPFTPGTEFTVFDIDGVGRFGIDICYDAWFPEVSRSLGWLGADAIINVVKTTTPDRAQETVLARANSIVNQVFTVSVNTAGPVGFGHSLTVGPEGEVLDELPGTAVGVVVTDFSQRRVDEVRTNGTAGTNRMWEQFRPTDSPIPLPIYDGRIDPSTWAPNRSTQP
jgi:predicted amidohydrolase